jgi:ABC-type transport system substrate-binding protein
MGEAGFTRDSAGFFAGPGGDRFRPQLMLDSSSLFEREMNTILDSWGQAGIDGESKLLPPADARNLAARTTFPGVYGISSGIRESQLDIFATAQIASEARGWAGNNRVGWSDPDFELAWGTFNSSLDRRERDAQVVRMMQVATDQLPAIMVHFNPNVTVYRASLRGPEPGNPESVPPNRNIADWTLS